MFLKRFDANRQVPLDDSNLRTRDYFLAGPELELEWQEDAEVVVIRRIVRPFGFEKEFARVEDKKRAAAELEARAKAPRKVLAIVPIAGCVMWPMSE